jgi:hypothetical protein
MTLHLQSLGLAALLFAAAAGAQSPTDTAAQRSASLREAPMLGSDREERDRLAQLLDGAPAEAFVVRSLSSRLAMPTRSRRQAFQALAPEFRSVLNATVPFTMNDGAMWAGRGRNYAYRLGVAGSFGAVRLVLAPELVYSENEPFEDVDTSQWYRPWIDTQRYSTSASPWNQFPTPADLPFRHGVEPRTRLDAGQSALWVGWRGVEAGVANENQWWGPGTQNAIVFTNTAPGFPHAFVRTARPLDTRIGRVEGRWLVGLVTESAYFDTISTNDQRSLAAAAVTLAPRWEPDLTVGLARSVFAGMSGDAPRALLRWLDVFQPTTRPNARSWSDSSYTGGRDQITSLFARWVFPGAGTEVYGEVGRAEWPSSLRDLLVDPTHTMGYLIGGQAAGRVWGERLTLRGQTEFTFLERSSSYRYRPTMSWYSSRATPQGYTQRGEPLGAGIGPGSSHQWLAFDVFASGWRAGLYGARWRMNADWVSVTPFPLGTGWCEYDLHLYGGARAGYRGRFGAVTADAQIGTRYNYLFQNNSGCPRGTHMRDVRPGAVRVTVTPLGFR